jgi:hypothetical protein
MSLEQAIKDLTAAVEANTAALAGGASKPASKPAGKAAEKPAGKAASKPAAKKGPGPDVLAETFGLYLKTGSAAERKEAKANVKAIIDHFEVDRITNLDPEHYEEALALLEQFKDGEDPLGDGEEEEEDDDSLM